MNRILLLPALALVVLAAVSFASLAGAAEDATISGTPNADVLSSTATNLVASEEGTSAKKGCASAPSKRWTGTRRGCFLVTTSSTWTFVAHDVPAAGGCTLSGKAVVTYKAGPESFWIGTNYPSAVRGDTGEVLDYLQMSGSLVQDNRGVTMTPPAGGTCPPMSSTRCAVHPQKGSLSAVFFSGAEARLFTKLTLFVPVKSWPSPQCVSTPQVIPGPNGGSYKWDWPGEWVMASDKYRSGIARVLDARWDQRLLGTSRGRALVLRGSVTTATGPLVTLIWTGTLRLERVG